MSLYSELQRISDQIQQQRHLITTEQATILVSIQPFIRALGYDTQNLAEVQPEFTADPHSSGTDRVDYVIKRDGRPIILIEVKSADTVLNKHHWKQLHNYFVALDVEFGVLTNGIEYRFFTDLQKGNVMDEEPFLSIDLRKLSETQVNILEGFSKSRYSPDNTVRKIKVGNLLEAEVQQPSDDLVKHFARQVHTGSIWQSVIEDFRPLVKRAWDDLVDQEIARRLRRHEDDTTDEPVVETPAELPVEPEMPSTATAQVPVFLRYKGAVLAEATLNLPHDLNVSFKKVITYDGRDWTIGSAAKAIIYPVTAPEKPSMNGFDYWRVNDPFDNREYAIRRIWRDSDLAQRIFEKFGE